MPDPIVKAIGTNRPTQATAPIDSDGTFGGFTGLFALFESKIDAKLEAQEHKLMRQASEEAIRVERDLSKQISDLTKAVNGIKPGATWWQNLLVGIGVAVPSIGLIFTVLAIAGSSFDSGVTSMGAVEEDLDAQREVNASQNERIDRILNKLEAPNAQPEPSPEAPEAP